MKFKMQNSRNATYTGTKLYVLWYMTSKNCFQTNNDTLSINDALFQKSTLISSDEVDTVPEQVNRDDFKDILTSNEEKVF